MSANSERDESAAMATAEGGPRGGSGKMFDQIARRYDLLNRLISFGLDQGWRRKLVAALNLQGPGGRVLDVATGTADVALAIHHYHPESRIDGLDPSAEMLRFGREKVAAAGLSSAIRLILGDGQAMPYEDDEFDATCISFGIRNVPDRVRGLQEMQRVTRPGGRIVILELAEPRKGLLAPLARIHVHHIVPTLGAWLSGRNEYRYLQRSIAAFPPAEEFAQIMTDAGLRNVTFQPLSFGAVTLYVAEA